MFTLQPRKSEAVSSWSYKVTSYNLLVLCSEDYIVEPASLQFLVQHGFDFSAQYGLGVGYNRGNDPETGPLEAGKQPLRWIFAELVRSRRPVVLHNGLIDLVFLYHNLWAALPPKLDTFLADVSEMFPGGVYDTKYIAEYVARTQASYLEFVFKKELRVNADKSVKNRPHVRIMFAEYSEDDCDIDLRHVGGAGDRGEEAVGDVEVCPSYANHGHCPEAVQCPLSHDIDLIVSHKIAQQDKKWRKRKVEEVDAEVDGTNSSVGEKRSKLEDRLTPAPAPAHPPAAVPGVKTVKAGGHRAGYDAFMTGFSLATLLVHHTQLPPAPASWSPAAARTEAVVNRIYLVSKDFPLLLQKSAFARCSVQHDNKMRRLGLRDDDSEVKR